MSYVGEARFRFQGAQEDCAPYIHVARVLVERTMAMFDVRPGVTEAATQTKVMGDGATVKVTVFAEAPPIITITAGGREAAVEKRLFTITEKSFCLRKYYQKNADGEVTVVGLGYDAPAEEWDERYSSTVKAFTDSTAKELEDVECYTTRGIFNMPDIAEIKFISGAGQFFALYDVAVCEVEA